MIDMTPEQLALLEQWRIALKLPGYKPYQLESFEQWIADPAELPKHCLYYKTGAGKTITALAMIRLRGVEKCLVLAPPITHDKWVEVGAVMGMEVQAISHAWFRKKDFKPERTTAIIVDEMHMLGGHDGDGWTKMDRVAKGLRAPLIVMSATPNYNDADRVYCVSHLCDPTWIKGGWLGFVYAHCVLRPDPFSRNPEVLGFHNFENAAEFLSSLPYVHYLPDDVDKEPADIVLYQPLPDEFTKYGLDLRRGRMIASQKEEEHAAKRIRLIDDDGLIRPHVMAELEVLVGNVSTPTLIFCNSSRIAEALLKTVGGDAAVLLTGKHTKKRKADIFKRFLAGEIDVLIGTATLATGADGMDRMCDNLIILDDTDDNALRRQLIGRILPRGDNDADLDTKIVSRIVMHS